MMSRTLLRAGFACLTLNFVCAFGAESTDPSGIRRETSIRAGAAGTIVAIEARTPQASALAATALAEYPHPRPRLAGFSPLVAITTSDEGDHLGDDYEHELQPSYVGSALNPDVSRHFVIGYLDTGSDVNLAAGTAADTLGLFGTRLGPNSIPIGGVGGQIDAYLTMPLAFFAAGLSAIDGSGALDYGALVGHSHVSGLAAPAIECGGGEAVTAIVGMPFLGFYNSFIRVDTPREATVEGVTYKGPDVQIETPDPYNPLPASAHMISMDFGGGAGYAMTANYYPDFFDLDGPPLYPTLLSAMASFLPLGGQLFESIWVREGEPTPDNPSQEIRVMVDTGAQSSIISTAVAANLSLPFEPDFTVDVCGVGGLIEDIPGYYIDYVKIPALGGALEFSRAPFVVMDLPSAEGGTLAGILGMNFFWNRNVTVEPNLMGTSYLHVSDPIPFAYGDFDADLDVDDDDASMFFYCMRGPNDLAIGPNCDHVDSDEDGDVDLEDYARFWTCYSGMNLPADPTCGD